MENTHDYALAFIQQHEKEHLSGNESQLIKRVVDDLVTTFEISETTAQDIALQAYAEHVAKGRGEYIDLSRTTSHGVFLRVPGKSTVFFTASELAGIASERRVVAG